MELIHIGVPRMVSKGGACLRKPVMDALSKIIKSLWLMIKKKMRDAYLPIG